jgi:hypothetical protein
VLEAGGRTRTDAEFNGHDGDEDYGGATARLVCPLANDESFRPYDGKSTHRTQILATTKP